MEWLIFDVWNGTVKAIQGALRRSISVTRTVISSSLMGAKLNYLAKQATGDIIVCYGIHDDYYPPDPNQLYCESNDRKT
jgi:hypothetical protein